MKGTTVLLKRTAVVGKAGPSRLAVKAFTRLFSNTVQKSLGAQPIVELREYDIPPEHAVSYMKSTTAAADLRKSLVPLRLFSLPETGGELNRATHAYYYGGGHDERDSKRGAMAQNDGWKAYLGECRPFMGLQRSNIFVEAPLVGSTEGVLGLETNFGDDSDGSSNKLLGSNPVFEYRRYKLVLGYDTVPKFLNLYESGLPSKLKAEGTDPTTSLVTVMCGDVGRLNEVIEIWRHGDGIAAMERSRIAARSANEWRHAIAAIAPLAIEFTSTIHKPTGFSPLK